MPFFTVCPFFILYSCTFLFEYVIFFAEKVPLKFHIYIFMNYFCALKKLKINKEK